jgi:hypothetical protein
VAAPRPPRFDAAAEEVVRTAAADWVALAAVARPCVAYPELAATRQHVVVGDVPTGGRPQFVNTSAPHDHRPDPAATGNDLLSRKANPLRRSSSGSEQPAFGVPRGIPVRWLRTDAPDLSLTNEIAGKLTSGDSSDVCQLWVAEEASDDLR